MNLLFVTPPMGNWAPWGERHLAVNPLYAQVAAFIREKKAADVAVLDCRALGLDDEQMIDAIKEHRPDVVFFGAMRVQRQVVGRDRELGPQRGPQPPGHRLAERRGAVAPEEPVVDHQHGKREGAGDFAAAADADPRRFLR